ncbi:MAG: hypothetical protein ACYDAY_07520 [Candidatus Dormibacteria bacterium]
MRIRLAMLTSAFAVTLAAPTAHADGTGQFQCPQPQVNAGPGFTADTTITPNIIDYAQGTLDNQGVGTYQLAVVSSGPGDVSDGISTLAPSRLCVDFEPAAASGLSPWVEVRDLQPGEFARDLTGAQGQDELDTMSPQGPLVVNFYYGAVSATPAPVYLNEGQTFTIDPQGGRIAFDAPEGAGVIESASVFGHWAGSGMASGSDSYVARGCGLEFTAGS